MSYQGKCDDPALLRRKIAAKHKAMKATRQKRLQRILRRENKKHIKSKDPALIKYLRKKNKIPCFCDCLHENDDEDTKCTTSTTTHILEQTNSTRESNDTIHMRKPFMVKGCEGKAILPSTTYFSGSEMIYRSAKELKLNLMTDINGSFANNNGMTVEFWILFVGSTHSSKGQTKELITENHWKSILRKGNFSLLINDNTNELKMTTDSYIDDDCSQPRRRWKILQETITPGSWTHLAVSVNHEFVRIFINGDLIDTILLEHSQDLDEYPLIVGAPQSKNGDKMGFQGHISDFMFFGVALTASEIAKDFKNVNRPRTPIPVKPKEKAMDNICLHSVYTLDTETTPKLQNSLEEIDDNVIHNLKNLLKEEDFIEKQYADAVKRSAKEFEDEKKRQWLEENEKKKRERFSRQTEVQELLNRRREQKLAEIEQDKKLIDMSLMSSNAREKSFQEQKKKRLENQKRQQELRDTIEKRKNNRLLEEEHEKKQIREYMNLVAAEEDRKYTETVLKRKEDQALWRKQLKEQIQEKERYRKFTKRVFNPSGSYSSIKNI